MIEPSRSRTLQSAVQHHIARRPFRATAPTDKRDTAGWVRVADTEPGKALSYKIGELKIRELRNKAEKKLGSEFNIRDFHEVVLEQGTVTLAILEERVDNYIQKVNNE